MYVSRSVSLRIFSPVKILRAVRADSATAVLELLACFDVVEVFRCSASKDYRRILTKEKLLKFLRLRAPASSVS